jgi:hypothetical protein
MYKKLPVHTLCFFKVCLHTEVHNSTLIGSNVTQTMNGCMAAVFVVFVAVN